MPIGKYKTPPPPPLPRAANIRRHGNRKSTGISFFFNLVFLLNSQHFQFYQTTTKTTFKPMFFNNLKTEFLGHHYF
jgi:hypothetical protein